MCSKGFWDSGSGFQDSLFNNMSTAQVKRICSPLLDFDRAIVFIALSSFSGDQNLLTLEYSFLPQRPRVISVARLSCSLPEVKDAHDLVLEAWVGVSYAPGC